MTNTINHFSVSKFAGFIFGRQAPIPAAPRHKTLAAAFAEWRHQRRARAELNGLSDRDLADIGLTRQEIPAALKRGQI